MTLIADGQKQSAMVDNVRMNCEGFVVRHYRPPIAFNSVELAEPSSEAAIACCNLVSGEERRVDFSFASTALRNDYLHDMKRLTHEVNGRASFFFRSSERRRRLASRCENRRDRSGLASENWVSPQARSIWINKTPKIKVPLGDKLLRIQIIGVYIGQYCMLFPDLRCGSTGASRCEICKSCKAA